MKTVGIVRTESAFKFFNEAADTFAYLVGRWMDEHEYEDIADYAKPLQPIAKRCKVEILKMTKHPFGCRFKAEGKEFQLTANTRVYKYKRIV